MLLSVNQTEEGIVLQWSPPLGLSFLLTDYVLQARRNKGQWIILSSNISANKTELLVQGLLRVTIVLFHHILLNVSIWDARLQRQPSLRQS